MEIANFVRDSQENYQICFLPFFNAAHHDIKMFRRVLKKVNLTDISYFVAPEYQSIEVMILMIKSCDLFVNMRYHASLLAMQHNKLNISICYDIHPHYFNKINYIHQKFNNDNIISYGNYRTGDLYSMLKKLVSV